LVVERSRRWSEVSREACKRPSGTTQHPTSLYVPSLSCASLSGSLQGREGWLREWYWHASAFRETRYHHIFDFAPFISIHLRSRKGAIAAQLRAVGVGEKSSASSDTMCWHSVASSCCAKEDMWRVCLILHPSVTRTKRLATQVKGKASSDVILK